MEALKGAPNLLTILQIIWVDGFTLVLMSCGQHQADPTSVAADSAVSTPSATVTKITIPEGTRLHVALIDGISTTKSSSGEQFMASLVEPVVIDGKTVLEKGTKVKGRITD